MVKKVCPKGKILNEAGTRCISDFTFEMALKKYPIKDKKVCPEGKKLTKTGNRCIKIKETKPKKITIKANGQRQTVCYEGYKMTKDGKCIKDKKYKTIVVPVETLMTGDLISFEEVAKIPSVKKSGSSSYASYMNSRVDEL